MFLDLRFERWQVLVYPAVFALFASLGVAAISSERGVLVAAASLYLAGNAIYLLYVVMSPKCHALSLVQGLFFTIFFAAPALVQLAFNDFPWAVVHNSDDLQAGMIVMVAGQLLVWLGFHRWRPKRGKALPELPLRRSYGFQTALAWAGLAVIYSCMPVLGFDALFSNRSTIAALAETDTFLGQLVFVCRSMSIVLFGIALLQWRNPSQTARGPGLLMLLLFGFLALMIFNNPLASPRYQFLAMVIAVASLLVDMSRSWIKAGIVGASVLFVFFFFPILKLISTGREVNTEAGLFSRDVRNYITGVDFDPYFWTVNTTIYLDHFPIRWGENLLGALLFWVPRGLWQGKPTDSGTMVSEKLGYTYNSVSNPLQAEAMMAFGLPGLIVLCFLFGKIVRRVEIIGAEQARARGNQMTVIYAFLAGFLPIILRGALNANAPQFGSGLLFMLIFYLATRFFLSRTARMPVRLRTA